MRMDEFSWAKLEKEEPMFAGLIDRLMRRSELTRQQVESKARELDRQLSEFGLPYPATYLLKWAVDAFEFQSDVTGESKYFDMASRLPENMDGWRVLSVVRYYMNTVDATLTAQDEEGNQYRRKFNDNYENWYRDRRMFFASVCSTPDEMKEFVNRKGTIEELVGRTFYGKIEQRRLGDTVIDTIADFRKHNEEDIPF